MVSGTEKLKTPQDEQFSTAAEVGRMFLEERTRRKLTILEVSEELRIRQLYLNCIESGELEQLPGYVYIVGFIKSYANFLELDQGEIFRQLNLNNNQELAASPLPQSIPVHQQQSPSLKVLFTSLTLLFIFGFSIYILKHVNLAEKITSQTPDTSKEITTSTNSISKISPAQSDEQDIKPLESAPPSSSTPEIMDEKKAPASTEKQAEIEATAKTDMTAQKGDVGNASPSSMPDVAQNVESKSSENISKPSDLKTETTKTIEQPVVDNSDKITIIASKDSWVQVLNTKGENIFVRLMHTGETFDVPATTEENKHYILNTGNGGGIKFRMNGVETPTLDQDGKVVRGLKLNQAHVKKMLQAPSNDPTTAPSIKAIERVE